MSGNENIKHENVNDINREGTEGVNEGCGPAPTEAPTEAAEQSTECQTCGGCCEKQEAPQDEAGSEKEGEFHASSLGEFIDHVTKGIFGDKFKGGKVIIGVGHPFRGERCERADTCPKADTCPAGDQKQVGDDDEECANCGICAEINERLGIIDTQNRHILQRLNEIAAAQPKPAEMATLEAKVGTMRASLTEDDRLWILEVAKGQRKKGISQVKKSIKKKFGGLTMHSLFSKVIPSVIRRTLDDLDIDYD